MHAKPDHPNQILPLTFIGHKEDLKSIWLSEIAHYISDPLTLHEHTVDDLRVDPTQVKQDPEEEVFRLLHRKASYESDGIKPSEVAKDHFLTPEQKELYAKQLAEEQQILQQQQQSFVQRKCQVHFEEQQIEGGSVTQKKVVEEVTVQKKADDKHAKLVRSTAIERSEEIQSKKQESREKEITQTVETQTLSVQNKSVVDKTTKTKTSIEKITDTDTKPKPLTTEDTKATKTRSEKTTEKAKAIDSGKTEKHAENTVNLKSLQSTAIDPIDLLNAVEVSSAQIVDSQITLSNATNQATQVHTVENQLALCTTNTAPQDGGGSGQQSTAKDNTSSNPSSSGDGSRRAIQPTTLSNRFQTVSTFTFRDRQGGPPGLPPTSNLPDFLIPPHLITYETSFEINVRKIPPPPPPPPPRFVKKLLVHTESLERKTRAFLTGNYEVGPVDSSIRTARQKIRSLKSTILKSDDEVKHAEDTITKAQSGDFLHIFNPPIVEKPLYEFIEIPSERSEEECSEFSDRRSERAISEQTQHENMEDYYSSRYSSRSSRRRVEGKLALSTF